MSEDGELADAQTILRYVLRVAGDVSFETVREKFSEVTPEIEVAMASPAEQLIQRGIAQGLELGREEGNRQTLARLLKLRFGELDATVESRIAGAANEQLEGWLDLTVSAETLEGVFAD